MNCKFCGNLKGSNKVFCSRKCTAKFRASNNIGKGNYPVYEGTKKIGHPNANKYGAIKLHRLLMSEKIGRPLKKGEVVHHINHNKHDNRIENLQLMTISEHIKHHSKDYHIRNGLYKSIVNTFNLTKVGNLIININFPKEWLGKTITLIAKAKF